MRTYLDLRELFDEATALGLRVRVVPAAEVRLTHLVSSERIVTQTRNLVGYDGPHDRVVYAGIYEGTLYHTPLE